ncbi:hypothetical protein [Microbacterium sp. BK668]|uniref:hypothetical protein n=1 Tax=Microbacterium sp. BK668 TaxID=2512118 RepID=UPI001060AA7A|nr:hypothetical protein [Microbacterium sp. BK668]TDN92740.1 hypothetical protein EV279_2269 [Microbacterium sp. BK668]
MTALSDVALQTAPTLRAGTLVRLARAAAALWRVLDARDRVIGHVEAFSAPGGTRYRARRFHAASRAFRDLGEFWSADDAIDCLRFER